MPHLTWDDLLIQDIAPEDSRNWLNLWSWAVGGKLAPTFLNKFGSWFLRRPDGQVDLLDVFSSAVKKVADRFEEFERLVNQQWWQETCLLSELVYSLHRQGKVSGPGQCYALAPHPAVGGPNPASGDQMDARFVMVMDIGVWQHLCVQFLCGERSIE